ncbi:DNA repair protein RecO [Candidatus Dojkabacteria bacterium]|nr:DNA repair protein RecO [Candidatus Dojkabacteria bacterium]
MLQKLEGIIINQRNYSESDKIITILSKEQGKISTFAKAARKPTSKKTSVIDLGNYCKFSIARSKGLGVLTEIQMIKEFDTTSLTQNLLAFYIFEITDKLMQENEKDLEVLKLLKNFTEIIILDFERLEFIFITKILTNLGFIDVESIQNERIRKILKYYNKKDLKDGVRVTLDKKDKQIIRNLLQKTLEDTIERRLKSYLLYLNSLKQ